MLQVSPFVLKIVTEGYRLPFIQISTPFHQANHTSALREREFVEGEIAKLVAAGCAKELPQVPFICASLSVVFNSSGKAFTRPVPCEQVFYVSKSLNMRTCAQH